MNFAPLELIHGEESFLVDRELRQIEAACKIKGTEDLNRELFDATEVAPSRVTSTAKTMDIMAIKISAEGEKKIPCGKAHTRTGTVNYLGDWISTKKTEGRTRRQGLGMACNTGFD